MTRVLPTASPACLPPPDSDTGQARLPVTPLRRSPLTRTYLVRPCSIQQSHHPTALGRDGRSGRFQRGRRAREPLPVALSPRARSDLESAALTRSDPPAPSTSRCSTATTPSSRPSHQRQARAKLQLVRAARRRPASRARRRTGKGLLDPLSRESSVRAAAVGSD